jgi:hypothetical protein
MGLTISRDENSSIPACLCTAFTNPRSNSVLLFAPNRYLKTTSLVARIRDISIFYPFPTETGKKGEQLQDARR